MPLTRPFAVQLVQRFRDEDPATTPALQWLDRRLSSQGTNADEIVREEHRRQGAANVTVRNIVTSMRIISELDWAEFFESVSLVDEVLRAGSDFTGMDFPTRNRYRRAIEELARGSTRSEIDVAQDVIALAKRADAIGQNETGEPDSRWRDPGYHLIGPGRRAFEKQLGFRAPMKDLLVRANAAVGITGYLATVAFVAGCLLVLALLALNLAGLDGWAFFPLAFLGLFIAVDAAIALVNRVVTDRFGPAVLPGLELRDGVSTELRTIVVMPTLLTTTAAIEELVERLEIHHLASPDDNVRFVLLSDWTDSATESAVGDEELLGTAIEGIDRLNARYGPASDGPRFFLLHRRRVWNGSQGKWIGWERKRGKLHELNRLLRDARDTTFLPVGGRPPLVPSGVRYVITLDTDTRLPIGAAKRLIGKMAHPLNRPKLDPVCRRVVEGYGVLQPRVTPALPAVRDGSVYQRVFSSPTGIDPYAAAVSDVYQDLFEEGSYSGKGIYDVDAFEATLAGRIADSSVLSHDLLESIFARAGLVSDVEVFEDFPSRYDIAAARQHRWARGDWQLLPWIVGRARKTDGGSGRADIPHLGRWKLVDNLRRTLSAPASVLSPHGRMGPAAATGGVALVRLRSVSLAVDCVSASCRSCNPASLRGFDRQPLPRISCGPQNRPAAIRHSGGAARTSGMADGRRNRPDVVQIVSASRFAGMGHRRGGGFRPGTRSHRFLSANGWRGRVGNLRGLGRCLRRSWVLDDRHPVFRSVDAVSGNRMVDQPHAAPRARLRYWRRSRKACASPRGVPGTFLKHSSRRKITCFLRTIFRRTPDRSWRTGHRRQISAFTFFRCLPREISAGSESRRPSTG